MTNIRMVVIPACTYLPPSVLLGGRESSFALPFVDARLKHAGMTNTIFSTAASNYDRCHSHVSLTGIQIRRIFPKYL